jgi:hypothetical protein
MLKRGVKEEDLVISDTDEESCGSSGDERSIPKT